MTSRRLPARMLACTAQQSSTISRAANGSTGQNPATANGSATPNVSPATLTTKMRADAGVSEEFGDNSIRC